MVVKAVPIVYMKWVVMIAKVKFVHAPKKYLLVSVNTVKIWRNHQISLTHVSYRDACYSSESLNLPTTTRWIETIWYKKNMSEHIDMYIQVTFNRLSHTISQSSHYGFEKKHW